jgi:hypothetical protein
VKALNVAKFIGMNEVEGWSVDKLMRFVTCLHISGFPGARMVRLTKKFTDGLCQKNPAGLQGRGG